MNDDRLEITKGSETLRINVAAPGDKRWRCANGHKWTADRPTEMSFTRYNARGTNFERRIPYCVECLAEQFARIAVPVEEVSQ